jgi:ribosome-associated protein
MGAETPISKTQRKKDSSALQDLGAALVALSDERLSSLDLPEFLCDAVVAARAITSHEARRRQLQYIGKLMRKVDAEPIRVRLEEWKAPSLADAVRFKRAEAWRERLLADDQALAALQHEYPAADRARLAGLIEEARRERLGNHPPKNYRALFQALRALLEKKA